MIRAKAHVRSLGLRLIKRLERYPQTRVPANMTYELWRRFLLRRRVQFLERSLRRGDEPGCQPFDPRVRERPYVVSMASLRIRHASLHLVLENLLRLRPKPQAIVVWLDRRDKHIQSMPRVKPLLDKGIELRYVRDIGPHTKWYFLANEPQWKDHDVLVLDDDWLYETDRLSRRLSFADGQSLVHDSDQVHLPALMQVVEMSPSLVETHEALASKGAADRMPQRYFEQAKRNTPTFDTHWPWMTSTINSNGIVYPHHLLSDARTRDLDAMMRNTPYHDDGWLWAAACAQKLRVRKPGPSLRDGRQHTEVFRLAFMIDSLTGDSTLGDRVDKARAFPTRALHAWGAELLRTAAEQQAHTPISSRWITAFRAQEFATIEHFQLGDILRERAAKADTPLTAETLQQVLI